MPVDHKEKAFESAIEHHLITAAGYTKADQGFFDQQRALDATQFIPFVKDTQPEDLEEAGETARVAHRRNPAGRPVQGDGLARHRST